MVGKTGSHAGWRGKNRITATWHADVQIEKGKLVQEGEETTASALGDTTLM